MNEETKRKIGKANKGKKHKKAEKNKINCLCVFRGVDRDCLDEQCFCPLHFTGKKAWERFVLKIMTARAFNP